MPTNALYDDGPGELILSSGVQFSYFFALGITPCFIVDLISVLYEAGPGVKGVFSFDFEPKVYP